MLGKIFINVIILFCFQVKSQNVAEINKALNLPDTLSYKNEIRIYKTYETTYSSQIFRMYEEVNNSWKAEIIYYSAQFKAATKIEVFDFPKENAGKLKPKDAEQIWFQLLLCDVEYLPNMEDIRYKLRKNSIVFEDGKYGISKQIKRVTDGNSYKVFVRNSKIENNFSFDNPENYLDSYPNVDELQSYSQLLSIIKKEFNLWDE